MDRLIDADALRHHQEQVLGVLSRGTDTLEQGADVVLARGPALPAEMGEVQETISASSTTTSSTPRSPPATSCGRRWRGT